MVLLAHLQSNKDRYATHLSETMDKASQECPLLQVRVFQDPVDLLKQYNIIEQDQGRMWVLTVAGDGLESSPEEFVARVQGYVVDAMLPPVRQQNIPRNLSRLIDLRQTISLSGVGASEFQEAVKSIAVVYKAFESAISARGFNLRAWQPRREWEEIILTFSNRYLTRQKDAGSESPVDLAATVDPFNVLRPLMKDLVHVQDNVVEYWERSVTPTGWTKFARTTPDRFMVTHLIEVQVSFTAVKVSRQEYVFVPRLRSLCMLDRMVEKDYNARAIETLLSQPRSPTKKAKRRVGYEGETPSALSTEMAMKRLRLDGTDPIAPDDDAVML